MAAEGAFLRVGLRQESAWQPRQQRTRERRDRRPLARDARDRDTRTTWARRMRCRSQTKSNENDSISGGSCLRHPRWAIQSILAALRRSWQSQPLCVIGSRYGSLNPQPAKVARRQCSRAVGLQQTHQVLPRHIWMYPPCTM